MRFVRCSNVAANVVDNTRLRSSHRCHHFPNSAFRLKHLSLSNKLVWTCLDPSPLNLRLPITNALILTCLTTRAVHLEMCVDLSCDATMNALQRFFSRRGYPAQLVSDRGTNFTAAEKELQKIFDSTQVHNFLTNFEIQWHFNPAQAPHFGGVWECLIRSYKNAFYSILGCQTLTDDTLTTLFCEV